jgi:hypothetical protein
MHAALLNNKLNPSTFLLLAATLHSPLRRLPP